MNKVKECFIISLKGSNTPIEKVAVCYQSKRVLAENIANLLPYKTVIIDSLNEVIAEEELASFSHAIEFYEPYGKGYEMCREQRLRLQAAYCSVVSCFDWQEHYFEDEFWGETDYLEQAKMLKEVAQDLDKVESFHITSDLGTDITFSTKGRRWIIADGLSKKNGLSQMPDGEIYTCPIEETFTGTLVIDGTVTRCWLPEKPQKLEFVKGKIVSCSKELAEYIEEFGEEVHWIGEFALSFNNAHNKIVKNISVDEKAAGTVHFAIGDSYGLGKNKSKHHVDMVIRKPKVTTIPTIKLPYF